MPEEYPVLLSRVIWASRLLSVIPGLAMQCWRRGDVRKAAPRTF